MLEPVGAICRPSDYGCGEDDGPQFIRCVDRWQPKIHGVWIFGEVGVTPEVYLTERVDVSDFVGDYFATNYLTPIWRRVLMFVQKSINWSVEWLGVPSFLRNDGPPWTLNLLAPYADWGGRGSITSQNLSSGSRGYSGSVFINWNRPARVLPIYYRRIFEKTHSAARCACEDPLMENRKYRSTACKSLLLSATPSSVVRLTKGMKPWMISEISLFVNNLCGEFLLVVSVSLIFLSFPSLVWVATNESLFGSLLASYFSES